MRIQAPPNLIGGEFELLLRAGIDDWGGVSPLTPDHVNPERPWPQIEELAERTAGAGFTLAERLPIYPEYVLRGEPWLDPRVRRTSTALADPETGLAVGPSRRSGGRGRNPRWRCTRPAGPTCTPRSTPRAAPPTAATTSTPCTATGRSCARRLDARDVASRGHNVTASTSAAPGVRDAALRHAEPDPAGLSDAEALTLLSADAGAEIDALAALADDVRRGRGRRRR